MTGGVDAERLLRELDEGWRQMGKSEGGGVLRACSMTMVAVSGAGEDVQAAGETLASIMHEHPNRTIVLRVDGSAAVEARTTILCWMPFGKRQQVCCEQIEIAAPRTGLNEVPPVLFGLMVADLPVAVWCGDPRLSVLEELQPVLRLASKVMVDTSKLDRADAAAVLAKLRSGPWLVGDLAWARITRWRQRVAQEIEAGCRKGDSEVTFTGEGMPMAAVYLGAWLEGVIGVPVPLRCEDPAPPAPGMGRIRSVRLGELTLRRTAPTTVCVQRGEVRASTAFPLLRDADLLREELGVFGRDAQYEAALRRVMEG